MSNCYNAYMVNNNNIFQVDLILVALLLSSIILGTGTSAFSYYEVIITRTSCPLNKDNPTKRKRNRHTNRRTYKEKKKQTYK